MASIWPRCERYMQCGCSVTGNESTLLYTITGVSVHKKKKKKKSQQQQHSSDLCKREEFLTLFLEVLLIGSQLCLAWKSVSAIFFFFFFYGFVLVGDSCIRWWTKWPPTPIWQMTISDAFFLMKMIEFLFKFYWNSFSGLQLTIRRQWFR